MSELYEDWKKLLTDHDVILTEMMDGLEKERQLLLASNFENLRETTFLKEKSTRKIQNIQDQIEVYRQKSLKKFDLSPDVTLLDLFLNHFPKPQSTELLALRTKLINKSKNISRVNRFNSECLGFYLDHITGIKKIMTRHSEPDLVTYAKDGRASDTLETKGGRLINRSL